jgi:hypothetical protein
VGAAEPVMTPSIRAMVEGLVKCSVRDRSRSLVKRAACGMRKELSEESERCCQREAVRMSRPFFLPALS